jgi:hypothetical protein
MTEQNEKGDNLNKRYATNLMHMFVRILFLLNRYSHVNYISALEMLMGWLE